MPTTTCNYCGASLLLLRAGARFCSTKCRVYASRAAKKAPVFPQRMTDSARWMRWKPVRRGARVTKMPITLSGAQASSTNAATWSDFSAARLSKAGVGLGFALGEGVGCIDLDHCISDGELACWAAEILANCPPTYVEVSQSGTGLHVFGLLAEGAGRNIRRGDVAVEFYSAGRFMAVTGDRYLEAPAELADLTEVVRSIS